MIQLRPIPRHSPFCCPALTSSSGLLTATLMLFKKCLVSQALKANVHFPTCSTYSASVFTPEVVLLGIVNSWQGFGSIFATVIIEKAHVPAQARGRATPRSPQCHWLDLRCCFLATSTLPLSSLALAPELAFLLHLLINSLRREIRKHHCSLYKAQASVVSEEASLTSSWLDSCSDGKHIFLLDANSKGCFEAAESDMAILAHLVVSQQDQISCKTCLWGRGDVPLSSLEHLYVWRQQRLIP